MNGYERFISALNLKEPDQVPLWEFIIDRPVIEKMYGKISFLDFIEKVDLDGLSIVPARNRKKISSYTYKDEWGIIWKLEPNGIFFPYDGPIRNEKDLIKYSPPDPDSDHFYNDLIEAIKRFKGEKAIVFAAHETFQYSYALLGSMEELFIKYITSPDFVFELADKIWSFKSKTICWPFLSTSERAFRNS